MTCSTTISFLFQNIPILRNTERCQLISLIRRFDQSLESTLQRKYRMIFEPMGPPGEGEAVATFLNVFPFFAHPKGFINQRTNKYDAKFLEFQRERTDTFALKVQVRNIFHPILFFRETVFVLAK